MKSSLLERVYGAILVVILAGIVVHAPLTVWLGTMAPGYELLIKSWKELLMVVAMALGLIAVTRRGLWRELSRDWLFRLIITFALLHFLLLLVLWNGINASLAGLSIDLRWLLYFGLVYVALRLMPGYRALFIKVAAAGALVVGVFAVLQVMVLPRDILAGIGYDKDTTIAPYLTVDKNPDYVRINSTLRGPNPLGAYAVIVLSILASAALLTPKRVERYQVAGVVTAVGMVVALWASYSRSALAALVASGVAIAVALRQKITRKWWIGSVIVVCALIGVLVVGRGSAFVSNVILHENPTGGSDISSNEGHTSSLIDGVGRLIHQPLGGGVGSTGSASLYGNEPLVIENQYLFTAHETGWLGLALLLVIFGLVLQRLWRSRRDYLALGLFAGGIGMALIGLLLPVWVDDTVAIIWWGLAGLAIGSRQIEDGVKARTKGERNGKRTRN
jgi:hypothetical protein